MPTFQAELADGRTIEFEAEREPTEQELADALGNHAQSQAQPTPKPEVGAGKAFIEHAAAGIGPGAAFVAGAAPGAEVGGAIGTAIFPGPGTVVGGLIGGLVTGYPASKAAGWAQDKLLHAAAPEFADKFQAELAAGEEQHPIASIAGDVASFGASAKRAPFKLAQLPFRAGVGAAVGAALPVVTDKRTPNWKDAMAGAAAGTIFGEPRFKLLPKATAAAGRAAQETLAKLKGDRASVDLETETGNTRIEASGPGAQQAIRRAAAHERKNAPQAPIDVEATELPPEAQTPATEPAVGQAEAQENAYREAERAAIDAGENEGSPVKIVDSFSGEDENQPFARQFMVPTADGIEVKRSEFQKWLAGVPEDQRAAAIQQRIAEEHIHRHVGAEEARDYWDSLTHVEKLAETRAYTGEWSQAAYQRKFGGKGFSDTQMGHEAIRRRMQRLASGTSSEIAEAAFKEKWKLESLDALSRTIRSIREALGTDASKSGRAILDRVEANLDAARSVIGKPADPDWQVTVQQPESTPDGENVASGYVQIDDVSGGKNNWSKNPQKLREEGYAVPLGMEKLPSGKYSMAEAMALLEKERPAALRKGPPDEPELPIGKTGPAFLSRPEKVAAVEGAKIPQTVIDPAKVVEAATAHFAENSRPSFPDFVKEVKTRLGQAQPGQLREAFEDAMWQRLTTMPGEELAKLRKGFAAQKEAKALGGQFERKIADPLPEEAAGFRLESERTPTAKYLDAEGRARQIASQRYRNKVIADVAERLMQEAREGRKAWHRPEISPDDIRYGNPDLDWQAGAKKAQKQPSYNEIASRDLSDPVALGRKLTEDFRASGKDALSATKRVTVALGKDGTVHVVATYRQPRVGAVPEHAMLVDPLSKKLRAHVPMETFLKRYRPIASLLLDEPVQNFHQKWASLAEYEREFGQEARQRASSANYDPSEHVGGEGEFEASGTGAKLARPGVYQDQPGTWDKTHTITDAEAGAIIDHILDESGSFEGPADVRASLNALGERTNRQALSGYRKLFAQLEAKYPADKPYSQMGKAELEARDKMLLNKLADQLYENHQANKGYEDFVGRTMGQGGAENRSLAAPEAASKGQGPTGSELTMPIERVPPTTLRPQMIPESARLKAEQRRPAPPVPEGSLAKPSTEKPAALNKFIEPAADELRAIAANVKGLITRQGTADEIVSTAAAASNIPHNLARQAETGIRILADRKGKRLLPGVKGDPQVLAAANALVQSGFEQSRIPLFQAKVRAGAVEARKLANSASWRERRIGKAWLRACDQLKAELDYADAHWNDPDLQAVAKRMKRDLDRQLATELASGLDISKNADYLPQRYDAELWSGDSVLMRGLFKGLPEVMGRKFKAARVFSSYYDAIAAGPYIAVTRDGASLVGHRVRQGLNQIARNGWQEGLKAVVTPDGKPLALEPKLLAHGGWGSPRQGYVEVLQRGGKPLIIHEDFANLIKNLTGESPIENSVIGRNLLHFEERLKHVLLIGDAFHFARMAYYGTSIMGLKANWRHGWSVLDIAPTDIPEALRRGVIRPEDAAWGQGLVDYKGMKITRRQLGELFQERGANLGMISDALYKDLITKLTPTAGPLRRGVAAVLDPTAGRWNRFLFDKLTRGLMMEANVHEFERQTKANPDLDHDAIIRDIAKDVNNYFGNIGQQGWFKARWQQDIGRMLFLAPQWVEGLLKKELGFVGRATGLSKLAGQRQGVTNLGTIGTGIGKGLVFMVALTQAINLIFRRQPTWMNEEKGHKFDAWIPSLGGNKEGFWLSPMSIFNELFHDAYRLMESKPKSIEAFQQIAGNKESPLTRAVLIGLAGVNPNNQYQTTSAGQLKAAAKALAPVPITFGRYGQMLGHAVAPSVVPANPPGAVQRQVFSTFGVKIEPRQGPAAEVARMAREFMKREGLEKETGWTQIQTDEPGYTKLRAALRAGDEAVAKKNLDALRKTRSDSAIIKAMKLWSRRGFTGSAKTERAFRASLNEKEEAAYGAAVDARFRELEAFQDFLMRQ